MTYKATIIYIIKWIKIINGHWLKSDLERGFDLVLINKGCADTFQVSLAKLSPQNGIQALNQIHFQTRLSLFKMVKDNFAIQKA